MDKAIWLVQASGDVKTTGYKNRGYENASMEEMQDYWVGYICDEIEFPIGDFNIKYSEPQLTNVRGGLVKGKGWTIEGEFYVPNLEIKAHTLFDALAITQWLFEETLSIENIGMGWNTIRNTFTLQL